MNTIGIRRFCGAYMSDSITLYVDRHQVINEIISTVSLLLGYVRCIHKESHENGIYLTISCKYSKI